jgi:hypothetical protein
MVILLLPPIFIILSASSSWLNQCLRPFDLYVRDFPEGRGLATTRDRSSGEVLLEVKSAITPDVILRGFPNILRILEKSMEYNQSLTGEEVLALGLLKLVQERDGYALSLPERQQSVLNLPASLRKCLPRCYRESVDAARNGALGLLNQINDLLKVTQQGSLISEDDFLWAFATVRSRSVAAPEIKPKNGQLEGPVRMLLPAFDLLNHKSGSKSSLEYREDSVWRLISQDMYQAGDQVFLSY